ncbi:MAG: siphovirus Gp157 family protein, partial [Lachnospiraceae bacterium]|nr:siphovirus Gp157 family protein [Lachnospiraceae bacterium]
MRALYEIDQAILDCVDLETGEILDPEKLTALQMEREAKLEGVALWVKDLKAEAEAVKAEADKLNARKKALDNKIEAIKAWLLYALNGEKLKTARCNVYQTHNTKLNVIDEQSVVNWIQTHSQEPEQYLKFTLPEIRKDA